MSANAGPSPSDLWTLGSAVVGVIIGAAVTFYGESIRDRHKERRQRIHVLRSLRRSLANAMTRPAPGLDELERHKQGTVTVPLYAPPIIVPYLDDGIALTSSSVSDRSLYLSLVDVKHRVEQINACIVSLPYVQTSSLVASQPRKQQSVLQAQGASVLVAVYDGVVRPAVAKAFREVLKSTDSNLVRASLRNDPRTGDLLRKTLVEDGMTPEQAETLMRQSQEAVRQAQQQQHNSGAATAEPSTNPTDAATPKPPLQPQG